MFSSQLRILKCTKIVPATKARHKGERGEDARDHRAAPSVLSAASLAALLCFLFHISSFLRFFCGTRQHPESPYGYASLKYGVRFSSEVNFGVLVLVVSSSFGYFNHVDPSKLKTYKFLFCNNCYYLVLNVFNITSALSQLIIVIAISCFKASQMAVFVQLPSPGLLQNDFPSSPF